MVNSCKAVNYALFVIRACGELFNGGRFDSLLTLLPLSSLTCSKEGSISFASSCFSSIDSL